MLPIIIVGNLPPILYHKKFYRDSMSFVSSRPQHKPSIGSVARGSQRQMYASNEPQRFSLRYTETGLEFMTKPASQGDLRNGFVSVVNVSLHLLRLSYLCKRFPMTVEYGGCGLRAEFQVEFHLSAGIRLA